MFVAFKCLTELKMFTHLRYHNNNPALSTEVMRSALHESNKWCVYVFLSKQTGPLSASVRCQIVSVKPPGELRKLPTAS